MNLPEYRRAIDTVHQEFADEFSKAQEAYGQAIALASEKLVDQMRQINAEFHGDPAEIRAAEVGHSLKERRLV